MNTTKFKMLKELFNEELTSRQKLSLEYIIENRYPNVIINPFLDNSFRITLHDSFGLPLYLKNHKVKIDDGVDGTIWCYLKKKGGKK